MHDRHLHELVRFRGMGWKRLLMKRVRNTESSILRTLPQIDPHYELHTQLNLRLFKHIDIHTFIAAYFTKQSAEIFTRTLAHKKQNTLSTAIIYFLCRSRQN